MKLQRLSKRKWWIALVSAWLLAGCADPRPRFGEATISTDAPRAMFTGTTRGQSPAVELATGCPGYLDPTQPAHRVRVDEAIELSIRARSDVGPLALAVAKGDEVHCDSDGGAGHAPTLNLRGPGEFSIYVAALRAPAELPYSLSIHDVNAAPEEVDAASPNEVIVTITSEPSGATVRGDDGEVVGTTPAMFVLPIPEKDPERRWVLELEGHQSTSIAGRLAPGALALHAQLAPEGASTQEASTPAGEARPRTPSPPRRSSNSARIPEVPPHAEIVSVLSRLRPTIIQRCPPPDGTVRVYFTLNGSGRVQRVTTSGSAGAHFRSCVAQVVRRARFPRFRRGSIDVDHTYDLARHRLIHRIPR